jgi:hypothetical protein
MEAMFVELLTAQERKAFKGILKRELEVRR